MAEYSKNITDILNQFVDWMVLTVTGHVQ